MHQYYSVFDILQRLKDRAKVQGEDDIAEKIMEAFESGAVMSTRPFAEHDYLGGYSLAGLAWMAGAMTALLAKVEEILHLCAGNPNLLDEDERRHLAVVFTDLVEAQEGGET